MLVRATALAVAAGLFAGTAAAQSVVAHFIVGVAGSFQQSDWAANIADAAAVGIDGFALDVGNDATLTSQVPLAYAAAEATGKFKVFLQFDYNAYDGWSVDQVSGLISQYASSPAQFKVDGKPLVSTFEGPDHSADWTAIKTNTNCFFAPDWTSAKGSAGGFAVTDGALSWDIWPAGANYMTDSIDVAWQALLGSKTYIMGISPWFYTRLPQYNKNWIARGSGLWHQRWQDAIQLKPQIVEIVTWNDFGESHYIGPNNCTACYPSGSAGYVQHNPHDGWRALLPAYINEYKTGNRTGSTKYTETLVYAHTTNPVTPSSGCADGGTMVQYGSATAEQVAVDAIDVYVLLNSPAQVSVTIGSHTSSFTASFAGVNYFAVPLNGQSGPVTYSVKRNGTQVVGGTETPGVSTDCSAYGGLINYNAVTGSYTAA